ncbi:PepSY domain-containing protein [Streptomyces sp. NPDC086077]|uniref:PepSY domain-containing protein n=1 Tax=Streptomyces sp. NPDC086077 TaxID=3154862 RepID=UPI003439B8C8
MKRNIAIAAVVATAVIGGGTTLAFAGSGGDSPATPTASASTDAVGADQRDDQGDDDRDDDGTAVRGAQVTAAEAVEAALKARPGTAVSADLDDDSDDGDDRRGWEVEVLGQGTTSYTVHVDPASGRVLGTSTDRDDDGDDDRDDRAALKGARVTALEAANAASAKGFVTSVDLDDDDRVNSWDVETGGTDGKEGQWNVDLKSGQVTADRDDDRDDDQGDDRGDRDDDHADDRDDSRADDRSDDQNDDRGDRDDDRGDDRDHSRADDQDDRSDDHGKDNGKDNDDDQGDDRGED